MDQQTFDSGFTKREFVVTTEDDRYPQDIKFECVRDKIALLEGVQPGQRVTVTFDLRGNEYNDRYYVNLTAWKLAPAEDEGPAAAGDEDLPPLDQLSPPEDEGDDSMPF